MLGHIIQFLLLLLLKTILFDFLAVLGPHCCMQAFSGSVLGFSLWWLLLRLQVHGLQESQHMGLAFGLSGLWHVGSSWTRDLTCVPGIARQTLNHWTTREAPYHQVLTKSSK